MPLPMMHPIRPEDTPDDTALRLMDYISRVRAELEAVVFQQEEVAALDTVTNFAHTTETFLLSVAIGPLQQAPGLLGILGPVVITANCAFFAVPGSGDNCTFRIRRQSTGDITTWPLLQQMPTMIGSPSSLFIMAHDSSLPAEGAIWVLTAQMAAATGGTTAFHRMTANQTYR